MTFLNNIKNTCFALLDVENGCDYEVSFRLRDTWIVSEQQLCYAISRRGLACSCVDI